jgi:hypothetical protein
MKPRPTLLFTMVASAATLALMLGACGGGDDESDTSAGPADAGLDEKAPVETPGEGDALDGPGAGSGEVVVADTTYTFTADTCVFTPDNAEEFSINGPGEAEDGTPVFVDAVGPNQLVVYVGTTDPFEQADTIYEVNPMLDGGGATDPMAGLEAEDGAVTATPIFYEVDESRAQAEGLGEGSFSASCG